MEKLDIQPPDTDFVSEHQQAGLLHLPKLPVGTPQLDPEKYLAKKI